MGYDHEEYFEEDDDNKPDIKNEFVQQTKTKKKRKLCCDKCDQQFASSSSLKQHRRAKAVECNNKYTCNDCGKLFSSKRSLAIHRKSFHLGNSFSCSFCPLKSKQKGNLDSHILKIHLNIKARRDHQCKECDKSFQSAGHLRKHKESQHDGLMYECEICPYQDVVMLLQNTRSSFMFLLDTMAQE